MRAYCFVDHLNRDNILQSPFLGIADNPQVLKENNPGLYEIADKYPLLDAGTGENPFLIKKKLSIGPTIINAILSPPTSQYKFDITIPGKAVLEFTYGIRRDRDLETAQKGQRTVEFSIVIEIDKSSEEIFQNTLTLDANRPLVFNYKSMDMASYAGRRARIYLRTRGNDRALACWFNPVMYIPHKKTKNVILISLDTLRADHLGCYGYRLKTSPQIDELAGDSALFLNAFATSSWTLPSHVSLVTSLNCINHQVYEDDQMIDPSLPTIADFLRENGYANSAITAGGYVSGLYGFSKGFDSYHVRGDIHDLNAAGTAAEAALDFIERNQDRDFFLFLHTYQIHSPYQSPSPQNEMFLEEDAEFKKVDMKKMRFYHENRYRPVPEKLHKNIVGLYDGGIRYTDEALIKPIIMKLKNLGLYDNSMIILTADHGEEFFEHNSWVHRHSVYNETIHIPLIVKLFQSEHGGEKIKEIVSLVDVLPTILDALDIDPKASYLDGKSLLDLISAKKEAKEDRVFISEISQSTELHIPKRTAINLGKYKLIVNEAFSPEDRAFFHYPPPEFPKLELYDLKKDPAELHNMAQSDPDLARRLFAFFKEIYVPKIDVTVNKAEIDEKLREELRALGYIK